MSLLLTTDRGQHVNKFIIAIGSAESNHVKHQKLLKMELSDEEWAHVDGLTVLLEVRLALHPSSQRLNTYPTMVF